MTFFFTVKHFSYNVVKYPHSWNSNLGPLPSLCPAFSNALLYELGMMDNQNHGLLLLLSIRENNHLDLILIIFLIESLGSRNNP